jgi:RNA polymerase sigma-70 factor (ECF subfamily)
VETGTESARASPNDNGSNGTGDVIADTRERAMDTVDASDVELAHRAARRDVQAFEAIMRKHNRVLYRTARSITQNDAEAEDAVQEAYLRAYEALPGFRAESSLRTWLTRIVINQALDGLRKRKREMDTLASENIIDFEAHLGMTDDAHTAETPERAAMRGQTRKMLEEKIDQLPSAFRTVFVMRALEELSVEETAACLGIPEVTVRTRFFRARRMLRESLHADVSFALEDAFAFDGERCDRIVRTVLERI